MWTLLAALAAAPTKRIAPGVDMPMVGLGTWQYNTTVAFEAVNTAFAAGYRHVDTALGCTDAIVMTLRVPVLLDYADCPDHAWV